MNEAAIKASWWQRWVQQPIREQLMQGTSPSKIAQAIAFGITLSTFPIMGSITLLTLLVGIPLKLNQPILQLFKTLAYPLHLSLILLFLRMGEWLFGRPHLPLTIPYLWDRFVQNPAQFAAEFGGLALRGAGAWLLVAPWLLAAIYYAARPLLERFAHRHHHAR